jgi:hypothetical protein
MSNDRTEFPHSFFIRYRELTSPLTELFVILVSPSLLTVSQRHVRDSMRLSQENHKKMSMVDGGVVEGREEIMELLELILQLSTRAILLILPSSCCPASHISGIVGSKKVPATEP